MRLRALLVLPLLIPLGAAALAQAGGRALERRMVGVVNRLLP